MRRQVGWIVSAACVLVALLALWAGILMRSESGDGTAAQRSESQDGAKAAKWVARAASIPITRLSVVDQFRLDLPLTGRVLYHQLVLDRGGQGQLLYDVILDESGEVLPQDGAEDRLWDAESRAYQAFSEERVIELISAQQNVPAEQLRFLRGVISSYLLTNRSYWSAQVMDDETDQAYDVAIDARGKPVNPGALQQAEFQAQQARYGRLDQDLYYLLQLKEDSDLIPVLLWIQGVNNDAVDRELIQRYPELRALRVVEGRVADARGAPVQLDDDLRRRVETEYSALLKEAHLAAARPVLDFLEARGYQAKALDLFPGLTAELPRTVILELDQTAPPNSGTIHWGGIAVTPELQPRSGE